jgi:predicted house-cleaning noncanonical NTP pyrophosphatase (MazG superfamily)
MGKYIKPEFLRTVKFGSEEHLAYLRMKLLEEFRELEASDFRDINEFADVEEVLMTIRVLRGIDREQMEQAQAHKAARRGDFFDGLIWDYENDPEFDPEKHSHISQ